MCIGLFVINGCVVSDAEESIGVVAKRYVGKEIVSPRYEIIVTDKLHIELIVLRIDRGCGKPGRSGYRILPGPRMVGIIESNTATQQRFRGVEKKGYYYETSLLMPG